MRTGSKRSRRKRLLGDVPELDLKPMMNLFVVLIPFLLACAQFAKIALVDIKLPERSDNIVHVKQEKEDEGLNLTIIVTDQAMTIGAKGGFMAPISYREFHKYSSTSDKTEFQVEYDSRNPKQVVYSPTDRKAMSPQERMEILLMACDRNNPADKGIIQKAIYNKYNQAVTDAQGMLLTSVAPGSQVYSLPMHQMELARSIADYRTDSLSAYDRLAADLLRIKARYTGQGIADENDIIIAAEDEIAYDKIVQIMDVCRATGFPNVSIAKMRG